MLSAKSSSLRRIAAGRVVSYVTKGRDRWYSAASAGNFAQRELSAYNTVVSREDDEQKQLSLTRLVDIDSKMIQSATLKGHYRFQADSRLMSHSVLNETPLPRIANSYCTESTPVFVANEPIKSFNRVYRHASHYSPLAHGNATMLQRMAVVQALGRGGSSPFEQTLQRVVLRATFSTQKEATLEQEEVSKKEAPAKEEATKEASTSKVVEIDDVPTRDNRSIPEKARDAIMAASKAVVTFLFRLPGVFFYYLTHPRAFIGKMQELGEAAKKEAQHYWMGTKLLYADIRTARKMLARTLQGNPLTRRERKQLMRTVSDLFRLVPMSMFVLIPFMEFALPFALRLFPNMLPSTFQDSLKAEENMKRELKSRIAMAQFFQETLSDLAKEQKKQAQQRIKKEKENEGDGGDEWAIQQEESASSMVEFLEKARKGEMIPPDVIIKFATHFHDDLTLDNMPRMQLINMCKYMSIPPYGADSFLRFQLRNRIRTLKEDDQRILWEGIDSLTKMELREACRERGMRSTGLTKEAYKNSLQQWLDLSVSQKVPVSLLIMSRTFFLRDEMTGARRADVDGSKSVAGLADAISGLDKEVLNEVVLEVATAEEKQSDPEVMKLKLEIIEQQNELIKEEQREREEAAKKKEQKEKEKEIAESSEVATEEEATAPEEKIEKVQEVVEVAAEPAELAEATAEKKEALENLEEKIEEEEETELSSEEMDAISELVSPDPVRSEREELQRIKDAISSVEEEAAPEAEVVGDHAEANVKTVSEEKSTHVGVEEQDAVAADIIATGDEKVEKEAQDTTTFSTETKEAAEPADAKEVEEYEDKRLDQAIKQLQSRVESMVGKIEVQLSDIEVKIGDKLHFLDKDMDGVLTQEEMANALQQVLKRELSHEEAIVIASQMDENEDGFLTVAELVHWLETHKIVKLQEEGRDADVDRIIAHQIENAEGEEEGETAKKDEASAKSS